MKRSSMLLFLSTVFALLLTAQDKPAMKFSGLVFTDYFYNVARDTAIGSVTNAANGGPKDFNGFQIRRIFMTMDNEFSSVFSARLRMEATTGAPFIKDAYLKWKEIFSGSDLVFGIQSPPSFEVSESFWGFRSVEKTIMDLRGMVSSRDFGVSLKGKLLSEANLNYWVLVANNSGVGAETDKYKRFYAHIDLKATEQLRATLYADYKMQSSINDPTSTTAPKKTLGNNVLTNALFVGYMEKGSYSVGAEAVYQMTANGYIHGAAPVSIEDKNALGLSLFGSYTMNPEATVFGRFDYFDANNASAAKGDARNFFVAGVQWTAEKNINIIPNILLETYEDIPTIGGSRSIDPSLTARVTLHYIFQ